MLDLPDQDDAKRKAQQNARAKTCRRRKKQSLERIELELPLRALAELLRQTGDFSGDDSKVTKEALTKALQQKIDADLIPTHRALSQRDAYPLDQN
jgi:hypothetical protein